LRVPIAGGFYFRFIPFPIYLKFLNATLKKQPVVFYIHTHELLNFFPRLQSNWWKGKLKYWGTSNALNKLELLFKKYSFVSVVNYLKDAGNQKVF